MTLLHQELTMALSGSSLQTLALFAIRVAAATAAAVVGAAGAAR
jgi:hypothetical protein